MTVTFVTTDITSGFGIGAANDVLDVLPTGIVTDTNGSAVSMAYASTVSVWGTVAGTDYGIAAESTGVNYIYVGTTGSISALNNTSSYGAVGIYAWGRFFVQNYGAILSTGPSGNGFGAQAAGTLINYGSITGSSSAVESSDGTATDGWTVDNYGTIYAPSYAFVGRSELDAVLNAGTVVGLMQFSTNANDTLDNTGTIDGNVNITGTITNSGVINGSLTAGSGSGIDDSGAITGGVNVTDGAIYLSNAQLSINGAGNTVNFVTGASNAVTLTGAAAWNNVVGSDGTVDLNGALSGVVGGGDTVNFLTNTTDTASLWNTTSNWDSVYGSDGTVYLNEAIASIVGGGDTVYLNTGTDNIASLWNTGGAWDSTYGSHNTVYLSDAYSSVVGGGDAIAFFNGSANGASIYNTGGVVDTVTSNTGASGALYINNAQANVTGNGDTIAFSSAGSNSANVAGYNETFVAQPISGADLVVGFNSSDQLYLSATQFGSNFAIFDANNVTSSGGNTYITDPNTHANVLTLYGVSSSVLTSANVHFG